MGALDWIELPENRKRWGAVMDLVMNLGFH